MRKYLFKTGYFLRKKWQGLKIKYLLKEFDVLFPGKLKQQGTWQFDEMPVLHTDASGSFLSIGNAVSMRGKQIFSFLDNGNIEIGANSFLNDGCAIHAFGLVRIGRDCLFGEGVRIYDHNHRYHQADVPVRSQGYEIAPVTIGNNCWLGSNVVVLKGVTIGDNCIVGANCTVFKDLPPNTLLLSSGAAKSLRSTSGNL